MDDFAGPPGLHFHQKLRAGDMLVTGHGIIIGGHELCTRIIGERRASRNLVLADHVIGRDL